MRKYLGLRRVDHAVNLDFRTPETEANISIWREFGKIQPSPVMNAYTAKKAGNSARFVLSVGAQPRQGKSQLRVGRTPGAHALDSFLLSASATEQTRRRQPGFLDSLSRLFR
jgi:hypothetical protein